VLAVKVWIVVAPVELVANVLIGVPLELPDNFPLTIAM
jgi:hypothetical protein